MKFGAFLAATDLGEGRSQKSLFDDVIDLAVLADDLGYDYAWLPEHELVRFIINSASLQEAVLIASKTSRITIGSAVFISALFHPLTLAADVAEADILTGGRYEPGLGRGASPNELRQLQALLPEPESKQRFKEFYDLFTLGLESNESLSYSGEIFQCENVVVFPRPFTTPRPRVWLASSSAGSAKEYASWGANVFFAGQRRPFAEVAEVVTAFREGGGGGANGTQFNVSRPVYVAPTMEEARKILPLIDYHERIVGAKKVNAEVIRNGVRGWRKGTALGLSDEEYMNTTIIGDPETVAEKIQAYADLGIDQFTMYTTLGQDPRLARRSMELFATEVMPRFWDLPALDVVQHSEFDEDQSATTDPERA